MKYFTLAATLFGALIMASTAHAQDLPQLLEDIEAHRLSILSRNMFSGV